MRLGLLLPPALLWTATPEAADGPASRLAYPVVDTGQALCYALSGEPASCPAEGSTLFGQDAQFTGNAPAYTDNGDGTITDEITGLTWQKSPDTNHDGAIDAADKLTWAAARAWAEGLELAGHGDWRLPSIKELYSLILFDGTDPSGLRAGDTATMVPFLDNRVFDFAYGDAGAGERIIDAQYATSTRYVSTTNGQETVFGVNFADGRIKGYGLRLRGRDKTFFVLSVRGNPTYGRNAFIDNRDGTVIDQATGLVWQQRDSGTGLDWREALAFCQELELAGHRDWRLPDAKELQSLVDYGRSPDTTGTAAIDPIFTATSIVNEAGQADYPAYWSSTTHAGAERGRAAAYVNFGRSLGYVDGAWIDIHGAGAQRSDPKTGDPADYPTGRGPQGDAIRIDNHVRCVRGGAARATPGGGAEPRRPGIAVESSRDTMAGPPGGPPGGSPGPGRPGRRPPREAVEACGGQRREASCDFAAPHGRVSGVCRPIGGELACVPRRRR